MVCRLHKAIYGLKQAPKVWFDKLKATLIYLGYSATKSDTSLFIKLNKDTTTYILVYVDDFLITGSCKKEIEHVIQFLDKQFSVKDLGQLNYFLSIEVNKLSDSELHLCQTKYIKELLIKTDLNEAKPLPTPMTSNIHLSKYKGRKITDEREYRRVVGAL